MSENFLHHGIGVDLVVCTETERSMESFIYRVFGITGEISASRKLEKCILAQSSEQLRRSKLTVQPFFKDTEDIQGKKTGEKMGLDPIIPL